MPAAGYERQTDTDHGVEYSTAGCSDTALNLLALMKCVQTERQKIIIIEEEKSRAFFMSSASSIGPAGRKFVTPFDAPAGCHVADLATPAAIVRLMAVTF